MVQFLFKIFTFIGSEWVMWVMFGISLTCVALIFERLRCLRQQDILGSRLWNEHVDAWMSGSIPTDLSKEASDLAIRFPCIEAKLIELISKKENSREELELILQSFLGKEKLKLEKNLSFLGTVGSNAPFIGLFGTVLGIIKAFHDLGGNMEGAASVSHGLSEALVATAVGLLVAIPAVVAFNYFQRKIKTIIGRSESLGQFLLSTK